jgi:hypothetical protein
MISNDWEWIRNVCEGNYIYKEICGRQRGEIDHMSFVFKKIKL